MARGEYQIRRLVRACNACVVGLWHLAAPTAEALAQDRQANVELEWIRLEGAEVCPPKSAFRAALEKRLGVLPFTQRADRVLTVSLSNENGPFRAVLSLKDKSAQEIESKQELFSYSSHCDEVFAATVLSVALLLNPDEASRSERPLDDEEDSGFFDPIERPAEAQTSTPGANDEGPAAHGKTAPSATKQPTYVVPVAPPPWARRYGYVGGYMLVAIEQLPESGTGLGLRAELPVARRWLLTMAGEWLGAQATDTSQSTLVSQSSGWLGGAWVPHRTDHFELWLEAGLGLRLLQPSARALAERPSHVHLATRAGLGSVVHLTPDVGISSVASAIFPFAEETFGVWTQPALGGQVQLGILVGFPGPQR